MTSHLFAQLCLEGPDDYCICSPLRNVNLLLYLECSFDYATRTNYSFPVPHRSVATPHAPHSTIELHTRAYSVPATGIQPAPLSRLFVGMSEIRNIKRFSYYSQYEEKLCNYARLTLPITCRCFSLCGQGSILNIQPPLGFDSTEINGLLQGRDLEASTTIDHHHQNSMRSL